jgi:ferredoxin
MQSKHGFLTRKTARSERKDRVMTHVVAEPCFNCKYTDCVVVCPVECFYEGESMLYIHPEECIDCEACVPECPVEAIFHEDNLPEEWKDYKQLNAELATQCPVITEKKEPLAGK